MASNTKIIITPTDQIVKIYFDGTPITATRVNEISDHIQELKDAWGLEGSDHIYLYEDENEQTAISINNNQLGIDVMFELEDGSQIVYEVFNRAAGGHQAGVWFQTGSGTELTGEVELNLNSQAPGKESVEKHDVMKSTNGIFAEYIYEKDQTLSHKTIIPSGVASTLYFNAKRLTPAQVKNLYDYIEQNGSPYSMMSADGYSMMLYSTSDLMMGGKQVYLEASAIGPGIANFADYQTIEEITGPTYIATDVVGIDTAALEGYEIEVFTGREQEANSVAINTQNMGEGGWTVVTCYYDGTTYYALPGMDTTKWTSATINQQGLATFESYGGYIFNTAIHGIITVFIEPVDPESGEGGPVGYFSIVDQDFTDGEHTYKAGIWYDTLNAVHITGETSFEVNAAAAGKVAVSLDGEPVWVLTTALNSGLQDLYYEKRTADTHCLTVAGDHCIVYPTEAYLTQAETLEIQVVPETDYATSSVSVSQAGKASISFTAGDNTVGVSDLTDDVTITINCTSGPGPGPSEFAFEADGVNCTINPTSGTFTQGGTQIFNVIANQGYIFDQTTLIEHTGEILEPVVNYAENIITIVGASTDFTLTVTCYEAPATHNFMITGGHCTVYPTEGVLTEGTAVGILVTPETGYVFNEDTPITVTTAGRVEYERKTFGIIISSATSDFMINIECQPETPTPTEDDRFKTYINRLRKFIVNMMGKKVSE